MVNKVDRKGERAVRLCDEYASVELPQLVSGVSGGLQRPLAVLLGVGGVAHLEVTPADLVIQPRVLQRRLARRQLLLPTTTRQDIRLRPRSGAARRWISWRARRQLLLPPVMPRNRRLASRQQNISESLSSV